MGESIAMALWRKVTHAVMMMRVKKVILLLKRKGKQ
jgi:hypothetical protein